MTESDPGVKISDFNVHFGDHPDAPQAALPLRVCLLALWGAKAEFSTRAAPSERVLPLSVDNFDQVFERFGPQLALDVKDPFDPGAAPITIHVKWAQLSQLRPNEIVSSIPELRSFVEAHRILSQATSPIDTARLATELERVLPRRHWSEAITQLVQDDDARPASPATSKSAKVEAGVKPKAAEKPADDLASLFDMVDLSGDTAPPVSTPPAQSPARAVVSQLAGGSRLEPGSAKSGTPLERSVAQLRARFSELLCSILEHPEVRRLEGLWRGLKVLMQAAGRRSEIQLHLAWLTGEDEGLEKVLQHGFDVVCLEPAIDASSHCLEQLERWGQLAAEYQTPLVVNGTPELLGRQRYAELNHLQQKLIFLDDPELVGLRIKASKLGARWLTIACNALRVRAPHDARSSRLKEMQFEQGSAEAAYVFMPPSFGVGALIVSSMAQHGHPFACSGSEHGSLSDLEVRHLEDTADITVATEDMVGAEAQENAAEVGIALWAPIRNRTIAVLNHVPLLFRGEEVAKGGNAPAKSVLSEAIFLSRLTRTLRVAKNRWQTLPDAEYCERTRKALLDLFPNAAPPGPIIEVSVQGDRLRVVIDPRRFGTLRVGELRLELAR